jgi:PKD repeat protein
MNKIKVLSKFLMLGIILISMGCSEKDYVAIAPQSEDAAYSFAFDTENPNKVLFTANPEIETWYTHWDFGDNSSAEGMEASKIYLKKGDYDVRFKVFTEGGEAESIQTIVINEDFRGENILQNGEFDGSDPWTILPISDGIAVSFDANNAHWTGGNGGHVGIYQAVNILPNNLYQISMDIKGGPLSDSWFEVYVGKAIPEPGSDYVDGGIRMGLSTWGGCGGEPFDGDFTEISCVGIGSTFKFPTAGTVYLVIRGGTLGSYGDNGVTIDNVSISSLESSEVAPPPLVANFSAVATDLTATFTNTSANATEYAWDFGDGTGISSEENPSYTYAGGGIYTVKLTVSNSVESVETTKQVTVIDPAAAPVAGFTSEVSFLGVTFSNTSANATSYAWDFGDGSGTSTDESPSYMYASVGTYAVTLTATKDGQSDVFSANVTTIANPNLISNAGFDDESGWTIINIDATDNGKGSASIADGVVKFSESESPTDPWKQWAVYTAVNLEPGTYQFDMDMTYTDINDVWGEVYIGATQPTDNSGQDYNGDQYVLRAYNAWDCGNLKTYSGGAVAGGCDPEANPGQFEIAAAGTYYLLFRTGGAQWGAEGIVLDNWSLLKL